MKKIPLILMLITFVVSAANANAADVTAKEILARAATATFDRENIATASGIGIKGKLTAVKVPKGQTEDLKAGFYAGIVEFEVTGAYGKLKTGRFNLFFKDSGADLKLYLEEKGKIAGILDVSQTTPANYQDIESGDKPMLAFPEPISNRNGLTNLNQFGAGSNFAFTSFDVFEPCKIYIPIYINGHKYWVWSGATRECGKKKPLR